LERKRKKVKEMKDEEERGKKDGRWKQRESQGTARSKSGSTQHHDLGKVVG
jgi:hypothetical protein